MIPGREGVRRFLAPLPAVVVFAMACVSTVIAERLNFKNYGDFEGLPQSQILAVTRDADGFLWIGTYGGLSRYDGRTFRTWTTADGLCANAVRDIAVDRAGALWIGTVGGGVCRIDHGTVDAVIRGEQLVDDDVQDLEVAGDGSVWAAGCGGVTRIRPDGTTELYPLPEDRCGRMAWKIVLAQDGRTLVGTDRGVFAFDDGRFSPVVTGRGTALMARSMLVLSDGTILVGTEDGLYRFQDDRLISVPLTGGRPLHVNDLDRLGDGPVWVATREGLFRLDLESGAVERLTVREGLPNEIVYRVFADREGEIWCGTDDGLAKLVPGPFVAFGTEDGLPNRAVRAIATDRAGRVWFGTRKGVAVLGDDDWFHQVAAQLTSPAVYALAPLADGGMLAGGRGGLFLIRNGRVTAHWSEAEGLPDDYCVAMLPRTGGRSVWIGTSGGIVVWEDGHLRRPHDPDLASARPLSMVRDASGRIWIGLESGGVLVVENRRVVRHLGPADGLSGETVWSLSPDGADGMWIGTNGDGAFHVSGARIERYTQLEGLANNFVWQVLRAHNGDVWFYTSRGLDRLRGGGFRHYGRGAGLIGLEGMAGAAMEDRQGRLWFASTHGVMRYDPAKEIEPFPLPAPALLDAVSSTAGQLEDGCRIPSPPGVLRFRVAVPWYRDEDSVVFVYRLLPVNTSWSAPQRGNVLRFASMAPGRYRLEVLAIGADGERSGKAAVFSFIVLRPWWRTPWAAAGWLLMGVLLVVASLAWRTRRIERERLKLRRMVDERTEEIRRQAEELERLATTDELTGTWNRRSFMETLGMELKRLGRAPQDARLALMILDLDGFKDVNDTWGHAVGDRLLGAIGRKLPQVLRSTDLVARYGGDEFAVLLSMTTREGAMVAATKLVRVVAATRIDVGDIGISVTASVGLAIVAPSSSLDVGVERLIARADVALYAAKRAGGNRVMSDEETLY